MPCARRPSPPSFAACAARRRPVPNPNPKCDREGRPYKDDEDEGSMILLYCEGSHGSTVLPASLIEGRSAQERRYQVVEHFMEVEAGDELVTGHDAEELCGHPGSGWRRRRSRMRMPRARRNRRA